MLIEKIKTFIKNYDYHFYIVMKGAFFNVFTNIFGSLASLLSSFLIAKYFGSSILGTLAILTTIFAIANLFSNFDLSQLIVRLIPEYRKKYGLKASYAIYHKTQRIRFVFMFLATLMYYLLINWLEMTFFKDSPYPMHAILMIGILIIPLSSIYVYNLQAIRALKNSLSYNILVIAPRLLLLLLLSIVISIETHSVDVIYAKLLGDLFSGILAIYLLSKLWKNLQIKSSPLEKISIKTRTLLEMASPFFLISFLYLMMNHIDILMLGSMLDEHAVGVYQIATKLTLMLSFIIQGVVLFAAPTISELYFSNEFEKTKRFIRQTTTVMFLVTLPLYILLLVFGDLLLSYFGKEFEMGYISLLIMATSNLILAWYGLVGVFMKMTGNQVQLSKIVFLSVLLNIGANMILIPKFGIDGAALASLLSTLLWTISASNFIFTKYQFQMHPNITLHSLLNRKKH